MLILELALVAGAILCIGGACFLLGVAHEQHHQFLLGRYSNKG